MGASRCAAASPPAPGGGKEPLLEERCWHPASPPADGHRCLCLRLRGPAGLPPPGGLSLHRACFLFVAGLSPGPAVPRAGDGEEPPAAWSAGDAAAPCSRCGVCLWAGGWGFLSTHRDQLRMPPHTGMELGCRSRTEPPEEAVGSPSLCFALYSLFFGYRLKPGCWDSGCRAAGPGAPAVLSAVVPVIPPPAGARMPLLGCGQCRAGRAKPFAAPRRPNPRFAGGLRKKMPFFCCC